jgi:hypothetical protein
MVCHTYRRVALGGGRESQNRNMTGTRNTVSLWRAGGAAHELLSPAAHGVTRQEAQHLECMHDLKRAWMSQSRCVELRHGRFGRYSSRCATVLQQTCMLSPCTKSVHVLPESERLHLLHTQGHEQERASLYVRNIMPVELQRFQLFCMCVLSVVKYL